VTEFAMMSTIMPVATGTKAIAVARPKFTTANTARSASAKIAKPRSKTARKQKVYVVHQPDKATTRATITTTTAHATGMVATAVVHRATTNFARRAPAWIP